MLGFAIVSLRFSIAAIGFMDADLIALSHGLYPNK